MRSEKVREVQERRRSATAQPHRNRKKYRRVDAKREHTHHITTDQRG